MAAAVWAREGGAGAADGHAGAAHESGTPPVGGTGTLVARPASPKLQGTDIPLLDFLVAAARRRRGGPPGDAAGDVRQHLAALFPPPSPIDPFPGAAPPADSDLLLPAVAAFWRHAHAPFPIVHRASFERAFRGLPTAYGTQQPLALAYAAAALGARALPGRSEAERLAFGRWCCERARTLLLARDREDVEAVQTLALLANVLLVADLPARLFVVLRRCAVAAERLYRDLPAEAPKTADEWIHMELVLRVRIYVASFDLGVAFHSGKPTFGNYFEGGEFPLPVSESLFDSPDPDAAFSAIRASEPPAIPFGGKPWSDALRTASLLASAGPSRGASVLSLAHLANFARHLRCRFPARDPGGSPARVRAAAARLASLADVTFSSLPPGPGKALARGDPRPLLRAAWFPHRAYAHSALQMILFAEALTVEALLFAGLNGAAAERCARYARILRHQLSDDPDLEFGNHVLASPAFLVGRVLLAERAAGSRAAGEDVLAVAAALDRYAAAFGLQPARLAAKFAGEVRAAGLAAPRPMIAAPVPEGLPGDGKDDAAEGAAVYFADAVLQGPGSAPAWIPAPEPAAVPDRGTPWDGAPPPARPRRSSLPRIAARPALRRAQSPPRKKGGRSVSFGPVHRGTTWGVEEYDRGMAIGMGMMERDEGEGEGEAVVV
ncbi:hypothetical protein DFJ74DRAFT_770516 [Hyaloraphidium curvatum]|nr:hypothetical protein DFJ74DRAFT_770516 [Hyaloraphidium curvatum]